MIDCFSCLGRCIDFFNSNRIKQANVVSVRAKIIEIFFFLSADISVFSHKKIVNKFVFLESEFKNNNSLSSDKQVNLDT